VSNVINGLTVKLDKLPASALREVVKAFTKIAEQEGGRMKGRYQLTAEASEWQVSAGTASVTMKGTPSGFWVWKETGTRPHTIRPRRKKALAGDLGHPVWGAVHHPGTSGKKAWTKTVERAERELQDTVNAALAKVA
jgi:hypothetical protein